MDTTNVQSVEGGLVTLIDRLMENLLLYLKVPEQWAIYIKLFVLLACVFIIASIIKFIFKKVLGTVLGKIAQSPSMSYIRYVVKNRVPHYISLLITVLFVRSVIPVMLSDFGGFISLTIKIADIYAVFIIIWLLAAAVKSFFNILEDKPEFKGKPMTSYVQVIQIILYIIGAVVIYSIITGNSPLAFFAAMGAASAVIMLIFQNSIIGFVSSIQLTMNNMVKLGDWITIDKYGADGTVQDITLNTVKILNFDNTVTTVPTSSLISDSFRNWRSMQGMGGRRLKRAVYVKHENIRFMKDEELTKYRAYRGLNDFIDSKLIEYEVMNKEIDRSAPLGLNRITNCDLYMQYALNYLKNHSGLNKDMTIMVRQLAPTSNGLPIEIYVFTSDTGSAGYESTSSEIMNHLISASSYFELNLHENSSSTDEFKVYMRKMDEE